MASLVKSLLNTKLWDWDSNTLVNPDEIESKSTQPIVKKERGKNGKYKISCCLGSFKVNSFILKHIEIFFKYFF